MNRAFLLAIFGAAFAWNGAAQADQAPGGQLAMGASYSDKYGATTFFSLEGQDILESGISARLNYRAGSEGHGGGLNIARRFDLSENWVGADPSLRISVFGEISDWDFQPYSENTSGISLRYSAGLSNELTFDTELFFQRNELTDMAAGVSPLIVADAGKSDVIGLSGNLIWSNRQGADPFAIGTRMSFGLASSLSGNDRRAWDRLTAELDVTREFVGSSVVNFSFGTGAIHGRGENGYVNILDRAFSGGGELRGFAWGGAGPVAPGTDEALGGTRYVNGTVEVRMPLNIQGISAGVFVDAGSVWNLPGLAGVDDDMHIRSSAGVALHWSTSFGTLEAAYAEPIKMRDGDRTQRLSISLNAVF